MGTPAEVVYVGETCPNCQNPLQLSQDGKCVSCEHPVAMTRADDSVILEAADTIRVANPDAILSVEDLRTYFFTNDGVVKAVNGVNLSVSRGETLGVVGESGCGKSITALSIMGLITRPGRTVAGKINFNGRNLLELPPAQMEDVRGNEIGMIFQEPMTALNPVQRVGAQIAEVIVQHMGLGQGAANKRVIELLEKVRIPSAKNRARSYPFEMSGGMRQRVMIAMALACNPQLLIADEPTTALDVTIQAQILTLIDDLKRIENMAVILITHDMGVVAEVADTVAVMYAGRVVEAATVTDLFDHPQHPYTNGLLESIPKPAMLGKRLSTIKGVVPHPLNLPPGCSFAPRCPRYLGPTCDAAVPALMQTTPEHWVACYVYGNRFVELPNGR